LDPNIRTHFNTLQFNCQPDYYENGTMYINNASVALNAEAKLSLQEALLYSANVPIVDAVRNYLARHPEDGYANIQRVLNDLGLEIFDLKGDQYLPADEASYLFEIGLRPVGAVEGADQSGFTAMARAYARIANAATAFADKPEYVEASKVIIAAMTDDEERSAPLGQRVWGSGIINLLDSHCGEDGESTCFAKTGTAQVSRAGAKYALGVVVKMKPNGEKFVVFSVGYAPANNEIGYHDLVTEYNAWGSTSALPMSVALAQNLGEEETISSSTALNTLNRLVEEGKSDIPYRPATIPASFLNHSLREMIKSDPFANAHSKEEYVVDLVGEPINGLQTVVATVYNNKQTSLVTFAVPVELVKPISPETNIFNSDEFNKTLYDYVFQTKEIQNNPALSQSVAKLQSSGVRFVVVANQIDYSVASSEAVVQNTQAIDQEAIDTYINELSKPVGQRQFMVHESNNSPLLVLVQNQMAARKELFAGREEFGVAMEAIGLNPDKTIFVNAELAGSLVEPNQAKRLLGYLLEQQGLQLAQNASQLTALPLNRDVATQNLLEVMIAASNIERGLPVNEARERLAAKFLNLVNNSKLHSAMPDVVAAYQSFRTLSLEEGQFDLAESQKFLQALSRFQTTSEKEFLLKLELVPTHSQERWTGLNLPPSYTPLPMAEIPKVDISLQSQSAPVVIDAQEIIKRILNTPEITNVSSTGLDRLQALSRSLVSEAVNYQVPSGSSTHQCYLAAAKLAKIVNAQYPDLLKWDIGSNLLPELDKFVDPKIGPQTLGNAAGLMHGIPFNLGAEGRVGGYFKEWLDEPKVERFQTGDLVVIKAPNFDSPGHVATVVGQGLTVLGEPYMLIFDANLMGDGQTRLIAVTNEDLFSSLTGYSQEELTRMAELKLPLPYIGLIRDVDLISTEVASR